MTEKVRENLQVLAGLAALLFIFYPKLFLGLSAPLVADHWEQHYPWAMLLAENIKRGILPFWTPLIHCGFPIIDEGQIGAFYLPNLILYFFLPFHLAYSWISLVHFLISGWGTYLYSRSIGLSKISSFFSACVFVFGTGYGGAYYNITSLKTIAWFPLILFFIEQFFKSRKIKTWLMLAFLSSLMLLAGYQQIAILSLGMAGAYSFIRLISLRQSKNQKFLWSALILIGISFLAGCVLSLPQLWPMFKLAMLSNRAGLSEEYAYVGSFFPLSLGSIFFPFTQMLFRGNSIYIGMFPLFVCFLAFARSPYSGIFKVWIAMALFSLLLALGEWSPLYIAIIKLTHFYSFRTPAKFLIFICFSLAIISALGFEKLWTVLQNQKEKKTLDKLAKVFQITLITSTLLYICSFLTLIFFRASLVRLGEWYIHLKFLGKAGHPHSIDVYLQKLDIFLNAATSLFWPLSLWTVWPWLIIVSGLFLSSVFLREKKLTKLYVLGACFWTIIDLYVFAGWDLKTDYADYAQTKVPSIIHQTFRSERKISHVGRIYQFRPGQENLGINPSANMLEKLEDIGAYSPFVTKRYSDSIGQFGNVNDSNGLVSLTLNFVKAHMKILNFLGVSHIISSEVLGIKGWELIAKNSEIFIYRNQSLVSKAHFISVFQTVSSWESLKLKWMSPDFDPFKRVLFEEGEIEKLWNIPSQNRESKAAVHLIHRSEHFEKWKVATDGPGFFVVTNSFSPEWKVRVNHKNEPLLNANGLFQSVYLSQKGDFEIEFRYYRSYKFPPLTFWQTGARRLEN